MMRASRLYRRAVVDLDTAERLGEIEEIIIDPDGPSIAGYVVASARALFGNTKRTIIPIDAVHAIGPDAVTVLSVGQTYGQASYLDPMPRLSELMGRRMVSFGGRYLGSVGDALINERNGRIIGYPLERSRPRPWLDSLIGLPGDLGSPDYARADGGLRIGARLIVVPDDAIASGSELEEAVTDEPVRSEPMTAPSLSDGDMGTATQTRQAHDRTMPSSTNDPQVTENDPEMQPSAEPDLHADDDRRHAVDPEHDTGPIAVGETAIGPVRTQPLRRPRARR